MDIGSLFINLGIKGSEKTLEQVSNVKKGIGDVASTSLEAKAALVGAMYALEQLFATSGRAGTDLTNFNAVTGESVKTLQQYQYAARQVGVSNESVASTFKTLQDQMTNAAFLGKGGPAGMAHVAQVLHENFSQIDVQKFAKSPELLLQKLQQYAAKETNIGLRNATLKSFGLGDEMIAALTRQAFRPEVLKKAPTYSDSEVKQLDKANIAWSNLGNKIQMAVGHFNAMHGEALVRDISMIVTQVLKLTEAFIKLAEKIHLFQGIGKVFEGWGKIFGAINSTVDSFTKTIGQPGKQEKMLKDTLEGGKNFILGAALDVYDKFVKPTAAGSAIASGTKHVLDTVAMAKAIVPSVSNALNSNNTQNHDVNITNNFAHPGVDSKQTSHDMQKSLNHYYRNSSAISQGA